MKSPGQILFFETNFRKENNNAVGGSEQYLQLTGRIPARRYQPFNYFSIWERFRANPMQPVTWPCQWWKRGCPEEV